MDLDLSDKYKTSKCLDLFKISCWLGGGQCFSDKTQKTSARYKTLMKNDEFKYIKIKICSTSSNHVTFELVV